MSRCCASFHTLKLGAHAVCFLLLLDTCFEWSILAQTQRTSKAAVTTTKHITSRVQTNIGGSATQGAVKNVSSKQTERINAGAPLATTLVNRTSLAPTIAPTRTTKSLYVKTTGKSRTYATAASSSDPIDRGAVWNATANGLQLISNPNFTVPEQLDQLSINMPEYVYPGNRFAIQCRWSGAVLIQVEVLNENGTTMLLCTLNERTPSVVAYYDFQSALVMEQSKASCRAALGLLDTISVEFYLIFGPTSTLRDSFYRCAFTSSSDYQMSEKKLLLIYVAPNVVAVVNYVRDGYNVSGYCSGIGKPPPSFDIAFSCSSCPLIDGQPNPPAIRVPDSTPLGSNSQWFFLDAPYLWDSSYVKCVVNNHPGRDITATTRIVVPKPYLTSDIPQTVDAGKAFTMTCTAKYVYATRVDIVNEKGSPVLSCYVKGDSSSVAGYGSFQPPLLDADRTMPSCLAASGHPPTVKVIFFITASLSPAQDGLYRCSIEYWNGSFASTMVDEVPGYPLTITSPVFGLKIYPAPAAFYLGTWSLVACLAYAKPPTFLTVTVSSPKNLTYRTLLSSDIVQTLSKSAPLGASYANLTFMMTQDWDGAVIRCSSGSTIISAQVSAIKSAVTVVAKAAEGVTSSALTLQPTLGLMLTVFALTRGWQALDKSLVDNGAN